MSLRPELASLRALALLEKLLEKLLDRELDADRDDDRLLENDDEKDEENDNSLSSDNSLSQDSSLSMLGLGGFGFGRGLLALPLMGAAIRAGVIRVERGHRARDRCLCGASVEPLARRQVVLTVEHHVIRHHGHKV